VRHYTVVGAGFTGATVARVLAEAGHTVDVLERRGTLGGNAADTPVTHLYGPHIFHTNSARVWEFLSRFTSWRPYKHRVVAETAVGRLPMPINLDTLDALGLADLGDLLVERYGDGTQVPILRLRADDDARVRAGAERLWDTFFDGYTRKMWGVHPSELSPGVTGRVPVRLSRDDRYFTDGYQALPREGYRTMFAAMLDHPRIVVARDYEWRPAGDRHDDVVYTGPVDELLGYRYGPLAYRSLLFDTATRFRRDSRRAATVNYPDELYPWTRETEMAALTGSDVSHVVRERPMQHLPGVTEPYYPIPMDAHKSLHSRYRTDAEASGLILAGRLADYKYYNMDQATARGLTVAAQITGGES
jgi:UDP-galactopyranose mutase